MSLRGNLSTHHICGRASLITIVLFFAVAFISSCGGGASQSASSGQPGAGTGGNTGGSGGGGGGGGGGTAPSDTSLKTEDVATGLDNPWSLAFAPDGRLFILESPGRLRVVDKTGLVAQPVLDFTSVTDGASGMDLDPDFASNGIIYVHFCANDGSHCQISVINVARNNGTLGRTIFSYPIPSGNHVGGRLKVGPDHLLYLTKGDHEVPNSAQDTGSLLGKVLRMNLDGSPAAGNPFPSSNPYVYAYGFRDPQGIAWDSSGQLYGTDHGPTSNDEVNIIFAGKNYGWPTCVGICNNPAFVDPVRLFSPETIPPAGAMFYHGSTVPGWDGSMFFAVLGLGNNSNAHHLHRLKFDRPGGTKIMEEQVLFQNKFGRIRDVVEGPDGFLYFGTSNLHTDVTPGPNDDRVIRVHP